MRTPSPVEAALVFAVGATVLLVGVPAFFRDLKASRLVEAMDGLEKISVNAASLAEGKSLEEAYPQTVSWTPEAVPAGEPAADAPGTWDHPTWKALQFGFSRSHFYSFQFKSSRTKKTARYRAQARGDLDGDGQVSNFSIRGEVRGGEVRTFHLEMHREIE